MRSIVHLFRLAGLRFALRRGSLYPGDTLNRSLTPHASGSDYPFMGVDDPISALDALGPDAATRRRLTVDHARELLALP